MSSLAPPPAQVGAREAVAPRLQRRTMGHFATGVAVITARDGSGRVFGATANSLTSVSLEPPLLLVCLRHRSETLDAIRQSHHFGVTILSAGQRDISGRFARASTPDTWDGVEWHDAAGVPMISGGVAELRCDLHELVPGGDHAIVIGQVVGADYPDGAPEPRLYHRGAYAELAEPADAADGVAPAVEAALPSSLGELRMLPLWADDRARVGEGVSVGVPRGNRGTLLHLHRGCVLGDAVGSAVCAGRRSLDAVLDLMRAEGSGVLVYHRRNDGASSCCLGGGRDAGPLTGEELVAVRRAVRALDLHGIRLIGAPDDARALADVGVNVSEVLSSPHSERDY